MNDDNNNNNASSIDFHCLLRVRVFIIISDVHIDVIIRCY